MIGYQNQRRLGGGRIPTDINSGIEKNLVDATWRMLYKMLIWRDVRSDPPGVD